ncbi:hypothetical protein HDV04_003580 [Boothiomyces sp. JEL0838]|nr:hypothetical protein HDV04_003580 [Boothiomyces sp. JEL0838]
MEAENTEVVNSSQDNFTPKRTILCAVDNSDCSPNVVEWAKKNLIPTSDLIVLVNAYKKARPLVGTPVLSYLEVVHKLEEQAQKQAVKTISFYAQRLTNAGYYVKGVIACGDPRSLIDQQIIIQKPDLVVVGSRGLRGSVQRFVLGSVSQHVVQSSPVPVVVVP